MVRRKGSKWQVKIHFPEFDTPAILSSPFTGRTEDESAENRLVIRENHGKTAS